MQLALARLARLFFRSVARVAVVALVAGTWTTPAAAGVDEARASFKRGAAAYQAGEFSDALMHYEKAHAEQPHPALLFNIAQCHYNLHDYDRAIFFYERFITEAPDAPQRSVADEQIETSRREWERARAAEAARLEAEAERSAASRAASAARTAEATLAGQKADAETARLEAERAAALAKAERAAADRAASEEALTPTILGLAPPMFWGVTAVAAAAVVVGVAVLASAVGVGGYAAFGPRRIPEGSTGPVDWRTQTE